MKSALLKCFLLQRLLKKPPAKSIKLCSLTTAPMLQSKHANSSKTLFYNIKKHFMISVQFDKKHESIFKEMLPTVTFTPGEEKEETFTFCMNKDKFKLFYKQFK